MILKQLLSEISAEMNKNQKEFSKITLASKLMATLAYLEPSDSKVELSDLEGLSPDSLKAMVIGFVVLTTQSIA